MDPEEEDTLDNAEDMEKCDLVRANPPVDVVVVGEVGSLDLLFLQEQYNC